jgi:hypothetical protein
MSGKSWTPATLPPKIGRRKNGAAFAAPKRVVSVYVKRLLGRADDFEVFEIGRTIAQSSVVQWGVLLLFPIDRAPRRADQMRGPRITGDR